MLWLVSSCADWRLHRDHLPQKLRTTSFYAEGHCGGLLSYQGAYAFGLAPDTVQALRRERLAYFDDIEATGDAPRRRYFSGPWRATPVAARELADGLGNLGCGPAHSWNWPKGVEAALSKPGGYYQHFGARWILVLPDLGLVVGVASDR